jgi:hypothetical protein
MNATKYCCSRLQGTPAGRATSYLALGLAMVGWFGACGDSGQSNSHKDAAVDVQKDTSGQSTADGRDGVDARPPAGLDASVERSIPAVEAGPSDALLDVLVPLADARILDSGQDGPISGDDTGGFTAAEVGIVDVSPMDSVIILDAAGVDNAGEGNPIEVAASEAGGETPASFACGSLGPVASDVSTRLCFDFSSPSDVGSFAPEAGTWSVVDGLYQAIGPQDGQITCPGGMFEGSGMTASVLTTLSAPDVRVHARMTSWTRPDKVLVLRSRPSGNRIELNFRSYYASGGTRMAGDVVVSALFDCNNITFVSAGTLNVPQYPSQPIEVDVQLRGQRLTIAVDGNQVYDDTPSTTDGDGGMWQLPSQPGSVGFGVFSDGQDAFDDLVVEVLK